MKKGRMALSVLIIFTFLHMGSLLAQAPIESFVSSNRSIELDTSGTIVKNKPLPWIFINMMTFPDQEKFVLCGLIKYQNGNTTIYNKETNEEQCVEGEHSIFFFNFYGPTVHVELYDDFICFEGSAYYVKLFGGK